MNVKLNDCFNYQNVLYKIIGIDKLNDKVTIESLTGIYSGDTQTLKLSNLLYQLSK